jgi:hypothetical protein
MATWASLTPTQQTEVQQYCDQLFRPTVLRLVKALASTSVEVLPQYLVSPTGLASTLASPAADSVAGILATLSAGEVVPLFNTGLALAGPLLASKLITYSTALNTLVGSYFTAAIQQDYAQIVGGPNIGT